MVRGILWMKDYNHLAADITHVTNEIRMIRILRMIRRIRPG